MPDRSVTRKSGDLSVLRSSTAWFSVVFGLLVLIGWAFGIESIKRVFPGMVAMNPMTSVLFVLLGVSLIGKESQRGARMNTLATLLGVTVVVAAALKIFELLSGMHLGIDTWLFSKDLATTLQPLPNRMAPNTAVNFVFLGSAVLFLDTTCARGRRPSDYLATTAAFIALLALLGYAYRIRSMTGLSQHIPMALNTAVTFLITAAGVFCARPKLGWIGIVTGSGPGAATARLLLPALVLLIISIGWMRIYGETAGVFSSELGVAIYTLIIIVLCVALSLSSARSLDKAAVERRQIESQREVAFAEIKESDARIRSVLDTAYDAFISIDANGKVIDWNAAAEKMFGRSRAECMGQTLSGLIVPAQHRIAHENGLSRASSPAGPSGNFLNRRVEITALRRDGSEFPIQMKIWPLVIGKRRTFNAFIADISEQKTAETKIQRLHLELVAKAGQLENTNHELEAFSYSVSHDLRAPLRHISGYARMLQEDVSEKLDGEASRYLNEIVDAARRMGVLIDNLLAFSRLGRKAMQHTNIDMRAMVISVLQENPNPLVCEVHIDELPEVSGDPQLLKQVWTNLISNAIKYSTPRGDAARIDISGESEGSIVRYSIRDNGVGFDMRYVDKLFGVFQRLHSDEEFDGSGVGLAIVERIVSRHGGSISAIGNLGAGATFTFELPVNGNPDLANLQQIQEKES